MTQPFVSVVVPARNGQDTIADCLESVLACGQPADSLELIVVDNGSSDRTAQIASRYPVRVVGEDRRGVSHARNRGIAESRGEIVAFLDCDCVVADGWLGELVRPLADRGVGGVGGELLSQEPRTTTQRYLAEHLGRWQRFGASQDPPFVVTANSAFRRKTLDEVGGFDPFFTRAQDVELSRRWHSRTDQRLAYAPKAVAYHRHPATVRGMARQQFGWAYGAGLIAAAYGDRRRPHLPIMGPFGLDLVRRVAWRAGFRAGLLRGRTGRPPRRP